MTSEICCRNIIFLPLLVSRLCAHLVLFNDCTRTTVQY